MKKLILLIPLSLGFCLSIQAQDNSVGGDYIKLVDALDEPEFYCVDLAGWGNSLQLEDPLQTHTCKGRNADDQMFHFDGNLLRVSKYDRCLQASGSSGVTLAGAAVIARVCDPDNPMQKLAISESGKIEVEGTGLCFAAGPDTEEASGPSHVWRTLTVEDCDSQDASLITWKLGM